MRPPGLGLLLPWVGSGGRIADRSGPITQRRRGAALEDSNVGTELPSLESLICEDDRAELIQQALALSVAVRKADRVSRSVGVPEEIGHVLAIARSIARIANG